jgi:hypothetical protein
MKAMLLYALAAAAIIGVSAGALGIFFHDAGDARALWLTAAVAFGVQMVSFGLLHALKGRSPWLGWGAGSMLRFGGLAVYALLLVKVLTVPLVPALVGYWMFVFFTMVIEPLFLRA